MTCNSCKQGWITTAAKGTVGLVKVVAGVDRATDVLASERLNACKGCPHLRRVVIGLPASADVALQDRCELCGCFVRAKVLIESETCPDGRW